MKIVNFKKFVRSIILILLVIFVLSLIFAKGSLSHKKVEYKKIYISNGDTLWSIASELQNSNSYYKNKDIRYIIDDMKKLNELETSNLVVGQQLIVPII